MSLAFCIAVINLDAISCHSCVMVCIIILLLVLKSLSEASKVKQTCSLFLRHDCSKSTSSEPDCNDNLPSHRTPTSSSSTAKHASVNGFFSSQHAPLYDSPPARGASVSMEAQALYQLPRSRSQDTVLLPKSASLSGTDSDAADVYVFNTPARKPSLEAQLRNMSVSYDIPPTPGGNCTYQVPRTAGGAEAPASDVVPPPRPPKPSAGPTADRSPTDTYVVPRSVSETDSNYCVPSGPGGSKTLRSNTIGPVDSSRLRKGYDLKSLSKTK